MWVHVVGGTIWFGPDLEWGETWATAESWKSPYAIGKWAQRKPDGTHPWDPFAGGGRTFLGVGDGRLVFGCVLQHSAVLNESVSMGRPDYMEGFGAGGYYMHKFGPRIGGWDVNMAGALFAWNELPGWIGSINVGKRESADTAFVGNKAGGGVKPINGAQVGEPGGPLRPPTDVRAEVYEGDAVKITWADTSTSEVGFRVDRKIAEGKWTPIAYRPPHITGHPQNPQMWIDFLAPAEKPLLYRVVALSGKDGDEGASRPTGPVTLARP